MSEKRKLKVILRTPERIVHKSEADRVTARAVDGELTVASGHSNLVTSLLPSALTLTHAGKKGEHLFVDRGILHVEAGTVTVFADSIEPAAAIDVARAQTARDRAQQRLSQKAVGIDISRAEAALDRALARLRTAAVV